MKTINPALILVGCISVLLSPAGLAEEMVTDGFEHARGGSALSGQKTEAGNLEWEASDNILVRTDKKENSLSLSNSEGFVARVPMQSEFSKATVEAEVRPSNATAAADPWIAVGFGGGSMSPGSVNVTWPRGIFLLVSSKGWYQCMLNPSKSGGSSVVQLLGGNVEGFSPDDSIPLKLEYDKTQQTVNMWVNGRLILKNHRLEDNGFSPDVSFAGVSGYGQVANLPSVDNFSLTVE